MGEPTVKMEIRAAPKEGESYGEVMAQFELHPSLRIALRVYQEALAALVNPHFTMEVE